MRPDEAKNLLNRLLDTVKSSYGDVECDEDMYAEVLGAMSDSDPEVDEDAHWETLQTISVKDCDTVYFTFRVTEDPIFDKWALVAVYEHGEVWLYPSRSDPGTRFDNLDDALLRLVEIEFPETIEGFPW